MKTKSWSDVTRTPLGLLTPYKESYFPLNSGTYELEGNDFCHHFGKYHCEAYNNRMKEMFMGLYL